MKGGVSLPRPIILGSHLYATAFPDVISHTLTLECRNQSGWPKKAVVSP